MDEATGPRVLAVCGLDFEAAIVAGPGVETVCGPGAGRVEARLAALLGARASVAAVGRSFVPDAAEPAPWTGIISFGCAGALDPALAPGRCVVAGAVLCGDALIEADADWTRALLARLPGAHRGLVAGLDAPLVSSADKARLWIESGACAVDMESHAAARAARRVGLPFAVLRVVLDPAWRSIPPCALAGMRADGRSDVLPLLGSLARDPRQLAALCALAREAWVARRALRRARALLGAGLGLLPPTQAPFARRPRAGGDPY